MAGEQGTGKHPHKSASDPKEHHEATSRTESKGGEHKAESHTTASHTAASHKTESHTSDHADGQGTGKHPHKKASDPVEHHEGAKAHK